MIEYLLLGVDPHKEQKEIVQKLHPIIDIRFSHFTEELFIAAQIIDPLNWPEDGLHDYGNEEIAYLYNHFQGLIGDSFDVVEAVAQWIELKNIVVEIHGFKEIHPLSIYQTLRKMQRDDIEITSALKIIEFVQLFPLATAVVERGFSHL